MRSREQQVLLVIAGILVVTSALGALKFRREREAVRSTLNAYAATVPLSLARPDGAPVPRAVLEALGQIRDHIADGQYALAGEQLEGLASERPGRAQAPAGDRETRSPGPGPRPRDGGLGIPLGPGQNREGTQVSPEAREFLDEHPELYRRARALAGAMIARRREGTDVGEAPELLRRALEAAEEGDARKVADLVKRTERELGGPPELPPRDGENARADSPQARELQRKMAEFEGAGRKAEAAGMDISDAAKLMPRIRQALEKRDRTRVVELLDEGIAKLKAAKPAPRRAGSRQGQRPSRGAPRGAARSGEQRLPDAQMAVARRAVETLMATMNEEQGALGRARTSIADAQLALREKNQDQVRDILRIASVELARIERGRQALVRRAQPGPRPPRESSDRRDRAEGPVSPRVRGAVPVPFVKPLEAMAQIGDAFDRVRTLSVDQYAEGKQDLVLALLQRVIAEPEQPEEKPEPDSPGSVPVTETSVRHKLQMAEGPYRAAETSGDAKAEEAHELLAEARRLLYEEQYVEASEALDRVLEVLGVAVPEDEEARPENE